MNPNDEKLATLLEAELSDYMSDEPDGWVRQAATQAVAAVRLAGWLPVPAAFMPAEEEPEGTR